MKPRMKKTTPRETAMVEINLMNLSISIERGVSAFSAL